MLTFDQAVERIKELDAQEGMTAFEMGDVALEQAPIGKDHAANGGMDKLERLAHETGIPAATLRERRFVSSRIPDARRLASVPWSAYQIVAGLGDADRRTGILTRIQTEDPPAHHKRWSVNAVRMALGQPPTNATADIVATVREASPERKEAVFTELTTDPIIREAALPYGPVRQAAMALTDHVETISAERARESRANDPVLEKLNEKTALLDLDDVLRTFVRKVPPLLSRISSIPAAERDPMANLYFLRTALAEAHQTLAEIERFVLGTQADEDARVRVLRGGRDG